MSGINKLIADWKKNKPIPAPVPVPVPIPTPMPVPATNQIKAAMFVDGANSKYPETCNTGVTSLQSWVLAHGKSWEDPYREDGLDRLQAAGSRWLVYIVDGVYNPVSKSVLAMCLADMGHPDDGRHAVPSEGWYDRCIAHGVDSHIAILRNSPGSNVPPTEQAVKDLIAAYKGNRWKEVVYCTGLETDRNTTVDQTASLCVWFKGYAPKNRVLVGSQSVDFLLTVADKVTGIMVGLEQAAPGGNPCSKPLTLATAPAYIALLDRLAAKVGASNVAALEWWAKSVEDRRAITKMILAKGYSCGCGDFK
jgi:hypothetical protein